MQIEFRLYEAGAGERPEVEWLAHPPLPAGEVGEALKAAGFDVGASGSFDFGRLSEHWHAHKAGCLVVTKNRELPDGEPFAVSLKPF